MPFSKRNENRAWSRVNWDPVELSGKTAIISTKPRPPENYYLFWIDHLVGKSSFKRGTEVFSFYIVGEMFRTNELFVDLVAASCVFDFYYVIRNDLSRHERQYKTLWIYTRFENNHNNSRIFSFLNIVFYWNNNLKLCFSLADTAVKNR